LLLFLLLLLPLSCCCSFLRNSGQGKEKSHYLENRLIALDRDVSLTLNEMKK
jgi:hypothetical protein